MPVEREHRVEVEGTGSRRQLVRWASEKSLVTSSVVASSKEKSVDCAVGRGMLNGEDVCLVEVSSCIASILSLN